MQCVLMAAGRGTRLGETTRELPKTLLPLQGRPLCHYIVEGLTPFLQEPLIVISGFQKDVLQQNLDWAGSRLSWAYNPDFTKGNLLTLLSARHLIHDTFCLMNSDHLYSSRILKQVMRVAFEVKQFTAICDRDRSLAPDDMKIEVNSEGGLSRMAKSLNECQAGYIGMSLIPGDKLPQYWKACEEVLNLEGGSACVESVLNRLVLSGERVNLLDVSGSVWIEVDTPEDWKQAESKIGALLAST